MVHANRRATNNGAVQQWCADRHLETHNSSVLVTEGILQQTTTPGSYQLKTTRRGSSGHHQHWTTEEWKNIAWSDEPQSLLRHADGRVMIWRKQRESMAPSCLVSTVPAGGGGGVMV